MRIPRLADLLRVAIVAIYSAGLLAQDVPATLFPESDTLSPAVSFWTRVYAEIDSASGFIHDNKYPDKVYRTLYLNPDAPPLAQNRVIEKTLGAYRSALLGLVSGDRRAFTPIEKRVARAWGEQASEDELKAAAERVRFQRGQSDRILTGLTKYARWRTKIQAILRDQAVPQELAALPLVESSYNPRAVSKAGAVGLWQFMPATARSYLRVDEQIDERLDPIKSSKAAALLLQHNYSMLERWPLAITAYNHGLSGVRRAVRETGTEDLGVIAKTYETDRFGFASRNFYASFLAAVKVAQDPGRYFREYWQDAGDQTGLITPAYLPVDVLVAGLGIGKDRLRVLNPALHQGVWNGNRFVPKGYLLQLPGTYASPEARDRLSKLAEHFGFSSQIPAPYYDIRRGDSLSQIAREFDTSAASLLAINQIDSADDIYSGEILRVPLLEDPQPLGAGSAAMLAAQRTEGRVDGDVLDLPRWILALVDGEADLELGEQPELEQARLASHTPRTGVADGSAVNPTDAKEKDAETATLLAEAQPDLAADPIDYGVADDGTIEIQIGETRGHYADWLQLRFDPRTGLDDLGGEAPLVVGRRQKLDFSNVSVAAFEEKRIGFHKTRLLRYLGCHRIEGVKKHEVVAGDSLWLLAVERYGVPLWLLRRYNPDLKVDALLSVGTQVLVPSVEILPDESSCTLAQAGANGPGRDAGTSDSTPGAGD